MNDYAKSATPTKMPEHLEIAQRMANEIMERFSAKEQCDAVNYIKQAILSNLAEKINEIQNTERNLQGMLSELRSNDLKG